MISQEVCKYYLNSKCLLEGGYCDLNCDRMASNEDSELYTTFSRWRSEEEWQSNLSSR
jgi:hypothetical protein